MTTTSHRTPDPHPIHGHPDHEAMAHAPERVPAWLFAVVFLATFVSLAIAQLGTAEIEMTHDGAHYLQIARSITRGEGFATYTHWALNLPKDDLPHPDTYRAPLYPLLVAAVSVVTGNISTAGVWASVLGGAFIPPLVMLVTVRRLGLGLRYGLLAASIALANHHLVIAGTRALTEAPYSALTLATLLFVSRDRPRSVLGGVAAGLAWLFRYQGVILIPFGLAALAIGARTPRTWFRRSGLFCAAFVVTIAPWLIRNQLVAGSPFYTELKYHVVSTYDPDRSFYQYFHGLTPPKEPLRYMVREIDRTILLFGHRLWRLVETFGRENAGNPLLLCFAILGAVHVAGRRFSARGTRDPRAGPTQAVRTLQIIGVFLALNVAMVSLIFAKHRHLTSCDPLVAVLAAVGVSTAVAWASRRARARTFVFVAIACALVLGIATEGVRSYRKVSRIEPHGLEHAIMAREIIGEEVPADTAIMAASPYFFAYVLDRPAVSLPWADDEGVRAVALRHDVTYICLTDIDPSFFFPGSFMQTGTLPGWMYPVGSSEDGTVTVIGIDRERALLASAADGAETGEGAHNR